MATKTPKTWRIGIDPGFGMTGVVLCRGASDPVAWELHSLEPGRASNPNLRAQSLATNIVNCITTWVDTFGIAEVEIAIETPVYKNNAGTLMLQMRLLQETETGLMMLMPSFCKRVWLSEVNPTTSKRLLTGNPKAKKPEMVAYSPWSDWKTDKSLANFDQAHTLADAWAHSLSAPERQHDLTTCRLVANTLLLDWGVDHD